MLFVIYDTHGDVRMIVQGEAKQEGQVRQILRDFTQKKIDEKNPITDWEHVAERFLSSGFNLMGYRRIKTSLLFEPPVC